MRELDRLVARLRGPAADLGLAAAREAHAAGDFAEARRLARPVVGDGGSLEAVRGLAELEYLLGDYGAAESLLRRVVEESRRDVAARVDAEAALALVYLQTNRFAAARGLFDGVEDAVVLPIWELMRSFGEERPYRIDWPPGQSTVTAAFTQTTDWELPSIAIDVGGRQVDARLDTGGDLLILSRDVAGALGIEAVAAVTGTFAGGAQGNVGYGRVEEVRIAGLTVRGVPVAIAELDRPVIGTGLLRQFLTTIDYPGGRLVLRQRSDRGRAAFRTELAGTDAVEVRSPSR